MDKIMDQAWIGDAVLALYLRQLLLKNGVTAGPGRSDLFKWFSSNQFLSAFGRPTEFEAKIGEIYESEGLDAALQFLDETLFPLLIRQLGNRRFAGRFYSLMERLSTDPVEAPR